MNLTKQPNGYEKKYQINWSGDSTLNAAIAQLYDEGDASTNSMCITTITGLFSSQVTDLYSSRGNNPDNCINAFGSDCVDALQEAHIDTIVDAINAHNGSDVCPTAFNVTSVPIECKPMFDNASNLTFDSRSRKLMNNEVWNFNDNEF